MAHAVEPEVLREYRENGAVCLRNVFSQEWVDKVRKGIEKNKAHPSSYSESLFAFIVAPLSTPGIEKNKARPSRYSESLVGEGGPGAYFNDYCNWRSIPEFQDFVYHSPAAQIAAQLMDSRQSGCRHHSLDLVWLRLKAAGVGVVQNGCHGYLTHILDADPFLF
uniref:Uncharacterized protein n=1 Tax=Branchiostoma floridae TaxID=7739 RepID=C3XT41_BRAFL|eukprot:XP_002612765.1 hypothetical protein BRAFLDRAFT_97254 [Branchiostoma floridae]